MLVLVVEVAGMLVLVVEEAAGIVAVEEAAGIVAVEEAAGSVAVEEGRLAAVVLDCRATVGSAGVELVAEVAGILVLVVVPASSQAQWKQYIPVLPTFCLCRILALPVSIYPNGRRTHHGTFH